MPDSRASARRLVNGSGNVTVVNMGTRGARLTFTVAQALKKGAQVYVKIPDGFNGYTARARYTIDSGFGTEWQAYQVAQATGTYTFMMSDPSTARHRGATTPWTEVGADFVSRAQHYLYVSSVDGDGNPDWYTYVDTLVPENGRHPYTRDRWTGMSWITKDLNPNQMGIMVPDVGNRVAALDALPPVLST